MCSQILNTLTYTNSGVLSRWDTRRSLTHACSCLSFLLSLMLIPVSSLSIPLHYQCGWMQVSLCGFSCSPFPYSCPSNMLATLASLLQKGALPLLWIWSEFSIYQTCLTLTMHDFQPLFFSFEVWSHSLHHCSYNQQVNSRAFIQDPCIRGVGFLYKNRVQICPASYNIILSGHGRILKELCIDLIYWDQLSHQWCICICFASVWKFWNWK